MNERLAGKKVVLIGPVGYGKSSTGNTLLKDPNAFSRGRSMNRVSVDIKHKTGLNGLTVVDCPGICCFI